jgi:hypothetical protein
MAKRKGKKLPARRRARVCAKPLAVVTTHKRVYACCARKLGKAITVQCPQVDPRTLERRELASRARKAAAEQTRRVAELERHLMTSREGAAEPLPGFFHGLGAAKRRRRSRR